MYSGFSAGTSVRAIVLEYKQNTTVATTLTALSTEYCRTFEILPYSTRRQPHQVLQYNSTVELLQDMDFILCTLHYSTGPMLQYSEVYLTRYCTSIAAVQVLRIWLSTRLYRTRVLHSTVYSEYKTWILHTVCHTLEDWSIGVAYSPVLRHFVWVSRVTSHEVPVQEWVLYLVCIHTCSSTVLEYSVPGTGNTHITVTDHLKICDLPSQIVGTGPFTVSCDRYSTTTGTWYLVFTPGSTWYRTPHEAPSPKPLIIVKNVI